METKRMNEIYENIAKQINDMIPTEWEKVWMYAEVLEDACEVYFYFSPIESKEVVYSHDIPEEYKCNYKLVNNKAIVPSDIELENNNRSRSAKLRIIERIK